MKFLMVGGCLLVAAVFGGLIRRNHERRTGWMCRLRGGHNDVLLFGGTRLRARCMDCGSVTVGWNLALGREERRREVA